MAMAAYVMALRHKPNPALVARLYEIRTALPRWGQAFLLRAMALGKADHAQIEDLEKLITDELVVNAGQATAHETIRGYEYELYMTSDVRATAMTLAALVEVDPQSPWIEPLVAGLKSARTVEGAWRSTQENLWSLVALAAYGKRASHTDVTATVRVGDKPLASKRLTAGQPLWTLRTRLADLSSDRLEITTDHPAHLTARVVEARVDPGAASSNGFTIARTYLDAAGHPATSFKAGDLVTVQLDVTATDHHRWIALVDPLPAGLEAQNPKLASGGAPSATLPSLPWAQQNLRDDRIEWFADDISSGNYQFTYHARATIDGTFTAMPATIEAMYQPDLHARTARTVISVAK
jgi:uncharacterized protein YfaS (alpha-2-macroglobulin family)